MIRIDYQDARPIYEQIVERFQILIVKQVLKPGDQLPSVRQMAKDLSINPNTIQKAYAMLEAEGYTYSVRGKGSFVAEDGSLFSKKEQDYLERLKSLLEEGKNIGVPRGKCAEAVDMIYGGNGDD